MADMVKAEDMSYSQLQCLVLGKKLATAAALSPDDSARMLGTIAKELRESLIALGLRKRKVRKPKEGTNEKAAKPKKGRG